MNEKIDLILDLYKEGDYQGFNYELNILNRSEKYALSFFIAEHYHDLKISINNLPNLFNSVMDSLSNPVIVNTD